MHSLTVWCMLAGGCRLSLGEVSLLLLVGFVASRLPWLLVVFTCERSHLVAVKPEKETQTGNGERLLSK